MPRRAVVVLVWLAGTAFAVVLATSAVGVVGRRVAGRPMPLVSAAGVADALQTDAGMSVTDSLPADDAAGLDPTATDAEASHPDSTVAGPGSGSPRSTSSTSVAPTAPDGGGTSSGPGPSATTTPGPQDEVYATSGGTVAVRCVGPTITLRYATPAPGFELDGSMATGPGQVDVRFRASDDSDREARVRAECHAGVPVERIEEK